MGAIEQVEAERLASLQGFSTLSEFIALLLRIVSFGVLILAWPEVMRAYRAVSTTTLIAAVRWSCVGLGFWNAALLVPFCFRGISEGLVDLWWYSTLVICVCAFVAVLGARRPGAGAWGFFVLVPLVLVLLWPAIAATRVWRIGVPLELEEPALIGFGLVMMMGCGNYFGTRFTLPVALVAGALISVLMTMSAGAPELLRGADWVRSLATILLVIGIRLAGRRARATSVTCDAWDQVWWDFMDQFGMVWGKRVMDRLNESARHEKWLVELAWQGFVWQVEPDSTEAARTQSRREEVLRWLLKRFVTPEWIDARLLSPVTQPGDSTTH